MRDLDCLDFNPTMEKVVGILMAKVQNNDPLFFRIMVSYFFAKVASMMRTRVHIEGTGDIPVNMYAINLATSGSGKGRSVNIMEDQVLAKFRDSFLENAFIVSAAGTMHKVAVRRANKNHTDPDTEKQIVENEFEAAGPMVFSFDSGTSAAVKQMRHKLLLAGAGSMNMEIDEIGSYLLGNVDVLNSFLELYDMGKIKTKLVKHTRDNARTDELFGSTPTNMLLFGTPTKLLNGSKTEEEFMDMLEAGYARRCFFGYGRHRSQTSSYTPDEIYDIFTDTAADNYLIQLSDQIGILADPQNLNQTMAMNKDVTMELIKYRLHCEKKAETFPEHEEVRRAEMRHRYFKAAKLAGVYAFIEQSMAVTEDHLYQSIALAEQSGDALHKILNRDRPYVRLASYICSVGREVTHADLVEDLPFYKGTEAQKREMMTLAIAHGYQNNMIIKKRKVDDIEFMQGTALPETDLSNVKLSYSTDWTKGYQNKNGHWTNLHKLCTAPDHHWCNHHFSEHEEHPGKGGYRDEAHAKPGFNLVVIDVDNNVSIDTAKLLLQDYAWFMHTTKRHTDEQNRFRLVLPISHVLEMDSKEYREFMNNVYEWLPFDVDAQTNQRSRKWETHAGKHWYNDGEIVDALQFIPRTKKAEERKAWVNTVSSLSNLERWFLTNAEEGQRNNMLSRYAFCLVDMGLDFESIKNNVLALNGKLKEPLPEVEVLSTVLMSAQKKLHQKED